MMRVNYDEEKKEYIKREDSKRKKEKHDNLNEVERKQLRKYEKEAKKLYVIILMMKKRNT